MKPAPTTLSESLQSLYDAQYVDTMSEWRELGAKYKAQNILEVCAGRTFSKAMEYGAGEGSILNALDASDTFASLYAVEISDSGIARIQGRNIRKLKEVRKFDGYNVPFQDKEFPLAYCAHVIEHVEYPRTLLREIRRISDLQVFEIPLDYTPTVDESSAHYLAYGHINVWTPSLFKFLLKSEGFEILSERYTNMTPDVIRFNAYRNMKKPKTLITEAGIAAIPLRNAVKKLVYGKRRYKENGYSAYTCLTRATGELKIFSP